MGIIQLCAFTPSSKQSHYDVVGSPGFHGHGLDGREIINRDPHDVFYNDLSEEEPSTGRAFFERNPQPPFLTEKMFIPDGLTFLYGTFAVKTTQSQLLDKRQ